MTLKGCRQSAGMGRERKNTAYVLQTCAEAQIDTGVMMLLWSLPFLGKEQRNERAFKAEADHAQLALGVPCRAPRPWRARQ